MRTALDEARRHGGLVRYGESCWSYPRAATDRRGYLAWWCHTPTVYALVRRGLVKIAADGRSAEPVAPFPPVTGEHEHRIAS